MLSGKGTSSRIRVCDKNLTGGPEMEYNTEVINEAASQIAEMMKELVDEQQRENQSISTIAQVESKMREILRQIGQRALG